MPNTKSNEYTIEVDFKWNELESVDLTHLSQHKISWLLIFLMLKISTFQKNLSKSIVERKQKCETHDLE